MLKIIHNKDSKECCVCGSFFIKHKDSCKRINQYNLKHKSDKKILYGDSLSQRTPKPATIPLPKSNLTKSTNTIKKDNDYSLTQEDVKEIILKKKKDDKILRDVNNNEENNERTTIPMIYFLTNPQISTIKYRQGKFIQSRSHGSSININSIDDLPNNHILYERRE